VTINKLNVSLLLAARWLLPKEQAHSMERLTA